MRVDFLASGLLVTEHHLNGPDPTARSGARAASVRFVTRYLLRLEALAVTRSKTVETPTILSPKLVEREGRAWVHAELQSPDSLNANLRLRAAAQIFDQDGRPLSATFPLRLPVRDNQPEPSRNQIPLLAGSRVVVHAPVPEPLFAGQYQLVVSTSDLAHRAKQKVVQSLEIRADEFPAQQSLVAQVVRHVEVSPSQLQLSVARGGNRVLPLTLRNRAADQVQVVLEPQSLDGGKIDWLTIRPKSFALPSGRERKVMVAVRERTTASKNQYGHVRVEISATETTSSGSQILPVALLHGVDEQVPQWSTRPATWSVNSDRGSIQLPITNFGNKHLAAHAELLATDELGRELTSEAGFGRWILPGESEQLVFPVPQLPAGRYHLEFKVRAENTALPVQVEQDLDVPAGSLH